MRLIDYRDVAEAVSNAETPEQVRRAIALAAMEARLGFGRETARERTQILHNALPRHMTASELIGDRASPESERSR